MDLKSWAIGLIVIGSVVGAGCGGGGSSSEGPGGQGTTFGPISVRADGPLKAPVVIPSPGYTVTGIGGAAITSAIVNLPPVTQVDPEVMYDNSVFALSAGYHPFVIDLANDHVFPLGTAGVSDRDVQPSVYSNGTRIATSEYDPATTGYQIFTTLIDGTARTRLTSTPNADFQEPQYVAGQGMLFVDYSSFDGHLYLIPTGSSTPAPFLIDGDYHAPRVSPDNAQIAFVRQNEDATESVLTIDAAGVGPAVEVFTSDEPCQISTTWLANGDLLIGEMEIGTTKIFRYHPGSATFGVQMEIPLDVEYMTAAPDGNSVVLADGSEDLQLITLHNGQLSPFKSFENPVKTICWGPYTQTKYMVGPLSWDTPQAAGFLFTQKHSRIGSFVSFNATTPSSVTITPHAGSLTSGTIVCTVEAADQLTSLKYTASGLSIFSNAVVTPAKPVTGAIVSFNVQDGTVASVVTYTSTSLSGLTRSQSGDTLTFKGNFVGVFDAKGHDLHPSGASEVRLDMKTGKLLSAQ